MNIERMFSLLLSTSFLLGFCGSMAHAGTVSPSVSVDLVPSVSGPYVGGESLTVDVWLNSHYVFDVGLREIRLDFSDSHPDLTLGDEFTFDYSTAPALGDGYGLFTFTELPVPSTRMALGCVCADFLIQLFSTESIHLGSVNVELPTTPGSYALDVLNVDEPASELGMFLDYIGLNEFIAGEWRAYDGDISGGRFDFVVIPEPATLSLITIGTLFVAFTRKSNINNTMIARIHSEVQL